MKNSKITLGLSILLLSASGAMASALHHRVFQYYYISGPNCLDSPPAEYECLTGGTGCVMDVGSGNIQQQYYLRASNGRCIELLQQGG